MIKDKKRHRIIRVQGIVLSLLLGICAAGSYASASPSIFDKGTKVKKLYMNESIVNRGYYNDTLVFSSSHVVTYHIDTNNIYTIELSDGEECFEHLPTVTIPSGWTFVGWAESNDAGDNVITSKTCDDDGINLYAVYKKLVTLSYDGNGSTAGAIASESKYRYYSCGKYVNPKFVLSPNSYSNRYGRFLGYRIGTVSGKEAAVGEEIKINEDTTVYADWLVTAIFANGHFYNGYGFNGSTNVSNNQLCGIVRVGKNGSGTVTTRTNKPINLTNYKAININRVSLYGIYTKATPNDYYISGHSRVAIGIANNPNGQNISWYFNQDSGNTLKNCGNLKINTSMLTGEYYIYFQMTTWWSPVWDPINVSALYISEILLEE